MNNVYRFWNLIHYNLYIWQKAAHNLFNYINPFYWFYKIPTVKKFYAKHGIEDMSKHTNKVVFNNPETGASSIWASIHAGGLLIIIEYGIFNFIQGLTGRSLIQYVWENSLYRILFMIALLAPSALINYFVLFRKDIYLEYFKGYEKVSTEKKRKYTWLCILTVLLIWFFFIGSFIFLIHQL